MTDEQKAALAWLDRAYSIEDDKCFGTPFSNPHRAVIKAMLAEIVELCNLDTQPHHVRDVWLAIHEYLAKSATKPAWRIRWRHSPSGHTGEETVTDAEYVKVQMVRLIDDGAVVTVEKTEVPAE